MATIPASELVAVNPSVLSAGGDALDVIGLILTANTRVPIGTVASFPDAASVSDYFGGTTQEASLASVYFQGFDTATKRPGSVLFSQYPASDVGAYLRGGDISGVALATLQSYSGTLTVTIDGVIKTGSVNLSAATSFSGAATIIADTLDIEGADAAAFTASISGVTMTVTAVSSGTLAVGQIVTGAGVTVGTYITALGSGTGGTGTYTVSASQTVGSVSMTTDSPGVTYDSVSGAFIVASETTGAASTITFGSGAMATSLLLTEATGAVLSQGAAAAVPADFMDAVVAVTTDWVCFMTAFNPDSGSNITVREAFAAWKDVQNDRYAYVCWDILAAAATTLPATSSLGYALEHNGDSGTCLVWAADATNGPLLAAFAMGAAGSINFDERNGRITFAFKSQPGLPADVTSAVAASNLGGSPSSTSRGNGYNFYGDYATANADFVWFQRGFVTGDFAWFDSYINQIWLNAALQIAVLTLLNNAKSIPYSAGGSSLIEAALSDPIQAGLNFGAFGPGTISAAQVAEVNADAGKDIASTLQTQGYYVLILPASSAVRAARTSPPIKVYYLDRGSVQQITLASIAVQ